MPEKIKFNPEEAGDQDLSPESEEQKGYTFQIDPPGMNKDLLRNSLKKGGGPIYFALKNRGEITLSFSEPGNTNASDVIWGELSLKNIGNIHDEKWEGALSFLDYNQAEKAGLHNSKTLEGIKSGIMDFLNIKDKPKDMAPHRKK